MIHSHVSANDRRFQTFSEFYFLSFVYLFYVWNVFKEEQNFNLGYFAIAMLFTYISVMLGFIVWGIVRNLKRQWRIYKIMSAYRKERTLRQKAL